MGRLSAESRVDQSDQSFEPWVDRRRGGGAGGDPYKQPPAEVWRGESRLGHGTLFPNKFLLWETAAFSMPFMHMSWERLTLNHTHTHTDILTHTHTHTQCVGLPIL